MNAALSLAGAHWGHMGNHGWMGGWWWLWGPIMMIFWFALAVAVTWFAVRWVSNRNPAAPPRPPAPPEPRDTERARDILAVRYAKGEISTEEYHERVAGLS
jgi:putative membrane protein